MYKSNWTTDFIWFLALCMVTRMTWFGFVVYFLCILKLIICEMCFIGFGFKIEDTSYKSWFIAL